VGHVENEGDVQQRTKHRRRSNASEKRPRWAIENAFHGSTNNKTNEFLKCTKKKRRDLERGLDDTTTKAEHQVKGGLLLNIVVRESAALLELLTSEDQALEAKGSISTSTRWPTKNKSRSSTC